MIIKMQILKGGAINVAEYQEYIEEEDAMRLMQEFIKELEELKKEYISRDVASRKKQERKD